jgi:molecular chaperone DnaK
MKRTIGIDLGTTNSCVATIDEAGTPRIVLNRQGLSTTPSVASFTSDGEGEPLVGVPAKRNAVTNPAHTVHGAKRFIGRRYDDPEVQQLAATLPYALCAAPNGDAWVEAGGTPRSPQEIAALVLAELKAGAEHQLGGTVEEAIITVPAYFDNQMRRATFDAAAIAGLKVCRLLNEPTAAALGYGAHRGANRRFAVCDLGGGTFDVSIVHVEDGVFEVIATHGDAFLGGEDFDAAIIDNLVRETHRNHGVDLYEDAQALQRMREQAEHVKHQLSGASEAEINLPFVSRLASGSPLHLRRTIRRTEIEAWSEPVLRRLDEPCLECVGRCGLTVADIDAIILVGGMTRMPAVQRRIERIFGKPPLKVVNPDEIVAVGAATQCALLDGTLEGVVLLDVTSRSIGIDTGGGRYQPVIARNSTIPTREHKVVATTVDDQPEVVVDVYEGESEHISNNRHLGRFACRHIPRRPAGEVLVMFDFTVDVDGILRVSARELGTEQHSPLFLTATAGLTRGEVAGLSKLIAGPR